MCPFPFHRVGHKLCDGHKVLQLLIGKAKFKYGSGLTSPCLVYGLHRLFQILKSKLSQGIQLALKKSEVWPTFLCQVSLVRRHGTFKCLSVGFITSSPRRCRDVFLPYPALPHLESSADTPLRGDKLFFIVIGAGKFIMRPSSLRIVPWSWAQCLHGPCFPLFPALAGDL